MADITIATGPFRVNVPANTVGVNSDDWVEEWGKGTFGATDDDAELALSYIESVEVPMFGWVAATGSTTTVTSPTVADGVPTTDGVITSGKITVGRNAHADGAASFWYRILGMRKQS